VLRTTDASLEFAEILKRWKDRQTDRKRREGERKRKEEKQEEDEKNKEDKGGRSEQ